MASSSRASSLRWRRALAACVALVPLGGCVLDWEALKSGNAPVDDAGDTTDANTDTDAGPVDAGSDTSPPVDACGSASLVVNEVQTESASGPSDEFVEIFNPSPCLVKLANWSLRYSPATGTNIFPQWTGGPADQIGAGGYFVIGGQTFPGTPNGRLSAGLSSTGGGVGIFDPSGGAADSMAYGSVDANNPLVRPAGGQTAPAPGPGQSVGRSPNGKNTGNNKADFSLMATPTPGAKN